MTGQRTAFVIDGFNVYHSLVEASGSLALPNETGTKWLDLRSLCNSYLYLFGKSATLVGVHYFSALAHHLETSKPGVVARHQNYAEALRATGVTVQFGTFKRKEVKCRLCKKTFTRYEEKETDVAVAMKVLEILHLDQADRVVLVTGDTDVAPAVRTAKSLFPKREVCFVFPWNRKMKERHRQKCLCHITSLSSWPLLLLSRDCIRTFGCYSVSTPTSSDPSAISLSEAVWSGC